MKWMTGEPPHVEGHEVLGWWDKSKTYSIIIWNASAHAWLCDEDDAVMNSPTHWIVLVPPVPSST